VLETRQLAIGYRQRRVEQVVARDISVALRSGELVCLLGPNGAGKSTLMRTIAGMQTPLAGHVRLDGAAIHTLSAQERARRLSIVLTERVAAGNLSARELVALGRYPYTDWAGRLTAQDEAAVESALEAVGAADLAARAVNELSDGERQKVMIARALAQEPALMLLDEPTAFLDLPRRVEIMRMLRDLAHNAARAVLLSTHDLDLALRSADRIWLLPQQGALLAGAPEDLVLDGSFAAAFASEGVQFDAETGSFHVQQSARGTVHLCGKGLAARWTRRALERAGLHVAPAASGASICIEIVEANGAPRWRVQHSDDSHADNCQTYGAISDLLHHLDKRFTMHKHEVVPHE